MKNNIDKEKLINMVMQNSGGKIDRSVINNAASGDMSGLLSSLNENDRKKITEALKDNNKVKEMLSSSAARELLGKLFNDG